MPKYNKICHTCTHWYRIEHTLFVKDCAERFIEKKSIGLCMMPYREYSGNKYPRKSEFRFGIDACSSWQLADHAREE